MRTIALLAFALPALAANDGVRISAALRGQEIRVTLENTGKRDVLIPLGAKVGKPHITFIRPFVKTASGATPQVIYTGLGVVAGVVEPLTMGLLAGEKYTVALPIDRYYVLGAREELTAFIKRGCRLWVELEVKENQCPNPVTLDPLRRALPCWHGKAVSKVLEMPGK